MSKHNFRAGNRDFLNKPDFHGDASMSYSLSVDATGWASGSISIRDCSQDIHLEIDINSDQCMENSEHKINTMLRLLREAKRELKKARAVFKKVKSQKAKNENT